MDESGTEIEEEVIIEDIPVDSIESDGAAIKLAEPKNHSVNDTTTAETTTPTERTIDDVPKEKDKFPSIESIDDAPVVTRLKFNDIDSVLNEDNTSTTVEAPKDIKRLEEISAANFMQRKLEEEEDNEKISILGDAKESDLGIDVLDGSMDDNLLDDVITVL